MGAVGNACFAFSKERWTRAGRPRLRQLPQTVRISRYDRNQARPPCRERHRPPAQEAPAEDLRPGEVDRE